ncbi:MAG: DUF2911 domain-containing protein [Gemmatimonadaceae bacterium]|nr:DUF2911 domain-containing protein [Gemmatimonadaceae bacterium]
MIRHTILAAALLAVTVVPACAQEQQPAAAAADLTVEASGRGRTAVGLRRGRTPVELSIDYGVPVLRGRPLASLAPAGRVWRLGANSSTTLKTEAELSFGRAVIPAGTYSLFAEPGANGWTLIVNKQSGQWGTQHDPQQDLARIPMTVRTLSAPVEAFTMWLIPAGAGAARGRLVLAWGDVEASADWTAK